MTVHELAAHGPILTLETERLKQNGFNVTVHRSRDELITALVDDHRRGCVLADLQDLDTTGDGLIEALTDAKVPIPVVVTDRSRSVPVAMKIVKAGAVDVMVDPIPMDDLTTAIDAAFNLTKLQLGGADTTAHMSAKLNKLTDREREVLDEIVKGLTTKEIARELGVSPRTVEVFRGKIMIKMDARNTIHLLRMIFSRILPAESVIP